MNHNLVPNMITGQSYENFLILHMQSLIKFFQAQLPISDKPTQPQSQETIKSGARNLAWQSEEDSILTSAVKTRGPKYWSKIAKEINYQIYNGDQLRKGKHCRERWYNHLNPDLNSKFYLETCWSIEEDNLLWTLQKENGNAWSLISKALPGRTENSVRNRWNILNKQKKKTSLMN